ncbi:MULTISPECIES: cation acetate symporter [unclassified Rhodococcus (in: high G+C Gram-positive bacteria)]|uniref:sodium/solute symporter n=2 Tax=Rhodococcus TaxID=1827 RepID=UPI0007BB65BD|nr:MULTISPECIES: cation acetate symporter [unclassified Rhodococcus (in: high G+C Gram-positive bacteria)]KZF03117.1 cation acetate symporter [Rhodococcus sp. EPR-279]OZE37363.1 cation acetate symporter [Rhodococcus sp. 05-2254-4]OZE40497.1 cation acetate symporter [Rhodococcus sp. 05-2254-3]OZE45488.1 cation acetate symporter [Rhodococcus sp. 05-2254-2]OZE46019.1 cation acetate symporter [Rhodococcus sp. 05-2254-6]
MNGSIPIATVIALLAAAVATVGIGIYGVRLARTTSDFLVASRSVGPRWNAAAISGEYLSAASFLGVAGLIAKYGADALWYPVGFTAGYLGLLLFVAAPLRRSGAYTVPDFVEFRLGAPWLRTVAMLVVVVICALYLVPQFQGAGLTLNILLGVPGWVGALAVGLIVIANVVGGGMRSITFVQAFQYWLKLTAIAIPALVLAVHFFADDRSVGSPAPPTVSEQTVVDITTDVLVQVDSPIVVSVVGTLDDESVDGRVLLDAGEHRLGSGTLLTLDAGSPVPVVAGAPTTDRAWAMPGGGLGGAHPLYQVYSLILATFLGTLGLPHVLVRFYTNPDGRAARLTSLTVLALLGMFYLFPTVLGVFARLYVPQLLITGASDAAVLLLPGSVLSGIPGQLLAALVAAGAIAAFLSTSSGLLVSIAGVLSTDVLSGKVRDFRVAAILAGAVPLALSIGVVSLDLSRTVGLVFAVAASTLCPLLVLGIWWRGLTAAGAAAGLFLGGGISLVAASISVVTPISDGVLGGWAAAILGYPAAVSVPVAFAAMIAVSLATRKTVPPDISRIFARLHLPEGLDMGKDREREL